MENHIIDLLARVGEDALPGQLKRCETPPTPQDVDVERSGPCVDAYYWSIPAVPLHLGCWAIWPEVEHFCCGSTEVTYHYRKEAVVRPAGGDLPRPVVDGLRTAGMSRQEVWDCGVDAALKRVAADSLAAIVVAKAVVEGELEEEWLPPEAVCHSAFGWLEGAIVQAFEKGLDPLPIIIIRRLFPRPQWGFSPEKVLRAEKGIYPSYGDGETILAFAVRGGWVYARAPKGSAQDNGWI